MKAKSVIATSLAVLLLLHVTSCAMNAGQSEGGRYPDASDAYQNPNSAASNHRVPSPPRTAVATGYNERSGRVIAVASGSAADFQAALNRATYGDIIELAAGKFVGNFTLPGRPASTHAGSRSGANWIVIRSAASGAKLPAQGTRISPSAAASFAKLVTPNSEPVLKAAPGAHHFRLVGLELTVTPGIKVSNLIRLGDGNEADQTQLPHSIILDRCYIHGDPNTDLRRGVALNCATGAIIDSYISDVHERGADSQAICGWNGPGPFKIANNYLEASGENIMFGGADPKVPDLIPSDIEIRRNHCTKSLSWRQGNPSYDGKKWSVKNLLELKNARRVLVEGNIFENVWRDAQTGYAILFKSVNQEGGAPWSATTDVDFKNNIVRHCGGGVNIQGSAPDQLGGHTGKIRIQNNLFYDIDGKAWGGDGAFIKITEAENVTVTHNTVRQTGNIITAYGPPSQAFLFTDNIVRHNQYGIKGDGTAPGQDTLAKYFPGYVFKKNALLGARNAKYPEDNVLVADVATTESNGEQVRSFRLSGTSPYRKAGTDGRDIGCDIDALEAAQVDSQDQSVVVR